MNDILLELAKTLDARKTADPGSSYVASLYSKGTDSILKKIGEEATEVVMAAKSNDRDALVHETADLWFHSLVLLSHMDLHPNDVLGELKQRYGRSGLEERASREE